MHVVCCCCSDEQECDINSDMALALAISASMTTDSKENMTKSEQGPVKQ